MRKIKRETKFIIGPHGNVYLPRPSGWLSGWMRHMWFEKKVGKKPSIASPEFWNELSRKFKTLKLQEYECGKHEIIDEAW